MIEKNVLKKFKINIVDYCIMKLIIHEQNQQNKIFFFVLI